MATKLRSLWLAANRALFSCIDWALLARCPRHRQSVFKVDSGHPYGHPCYGQLTAVNRVSTDQCHMTVSRAQEYNSLRWCAFLKIFPDQLLFLIERRLRSIMKRPYNKYLINVFRSVITEMQLLASGVKNWVCWTLDVSCYLRVWRLMQLVSVLEGPSTFLVPNPFSRPSRFLREKPWDRKRWGSLRAGSLVRVQRSESARRVTGEGKEKRQV